MELAEYNYRLHRERLGMTKPIVAAIIFWCPNYSVYRIGDRGTIIIPHDEDGAPTDGWAVQRLDPHPIILEAVCGKCGETFNPNNEEDTIHAMREDETPCGGQGEITGSWG